MVKMILLHERNESIDVAVPVNRIIRVESISNYVAGSRVVYAKGKNHLDSVEVSETVEKIVEIINDMKED